MINATNNSDPAAMKIFLAQGADPNQIVPEEYDYFSTVLMLAVTKGCNECVKALIEKGADCNKTDSYGSAAIILAARGGCLDCVETLFTNCNQSSKESALIMAAREGKIKVVKFFLDKGIGPECGENCCAQPIQYAASEGHIDCVKLLLDRGADLNKEGRWGTTVLHGAAAAGKATCVTLFLDRGVDPNRANPQGETPLMAAARNCDTNHMEVIKALFAWKADPNIKSQTGMTALMFAVSPFNNNKDCVQVLLANGADPMDKDDCGLTAFSWAIYHRDQCERECKEVVAKLQKRGVIVEYNPVIHKGEPIAPPSLCRSLEESLKLDRFTMPLLNLDVSVDTIDTTPLVDNTAIPYNRSVESEKEALLWGIDNASECQKEFKHIEKQANEKGYYLHYHLGHINYYTVGHNPFSSEEDDNKEEQESAFKDL